MKKASCMTLATIGARSRNRAHSMPSKRARQRGIDADIASPSSANSAPGPGHSRQISSPDDDQRQIVRGDDRIAEHAAQDVDGIGQRQLADDAVGAGQAGGGIRHHLEMAFQMIMLTERNGR